MSDKYQDIDDIIKNVPFEDLSNEQKELLGEEMTSADEYNQMKSFLLTMEANPEPSLAAPDRIKNNLMDMFEPKKEKAAAFNWQESIKNWIALLNRPTYKMALVTASVALLFWVSYEVLDDWAATETIAMQDTEKTQESNSPAEDVSSTLTVEEESEESNTEEDLLFDLEEPPVASAPREEIIVGAGTDSELKEGTYKSIVLDENAVVFSTGGTEEPVTAYSFGTGITDVDSEDDGLSTTQVQTAGSTSDVRAFEKYFGDSYTSNAEVGNADKGYRNSQDPSDVNWNANVTDTRKSYKKESFSDLSLNKSDKDVKPGLTAPSRLEIVEEEMEEEEDFDDANGYVSSFDVADEINEESYGSVATDSIDIKYSIVGNSRAHKLEEKKLYFANDKTTVERSFDQPKPLPGNADQYEFLMDDLFTAL